MIYFFFAALSIRAFIYYMNKTLESAVILSGQAFNGFDKETRKPQFDRIYISNATMSELCVFFGPMTDYFNVPIGVWLGPGVFMRTPGGYGAKTLVACTLSQLWNGFYPSVVLSLTYLNIAIFNFEFIYKKFAENKMLRNPVCHIAVMYLRRHTMNRIFGKFSIYYFNVAYGVDYYDAFLTLSKGVAWIPMAHLLIFAAVIVLGNSKGSQDSKSTDEPKDYLKLKVHQLLRN